MQNALFTQKLPDKGENPRISADWMSYWLQMRRPCLNKTVHARRITAFGGPPGSTSQAARSKQIRTDDRSCLFCRHVDGDHNDEVFSLMRHINLLLTDYPDTTNAIHQFMWNCSNLQVEWVILYTITMRTKGASGQRQSGNFPPEF